MPTNVLLIRAVVYDLSLLLTIGLLFRAVWSYAASRNRKPSLIERAKYVRAPGLVSFMYLSLAANMVFPSLLLYLGTGALWGLSLPLRIVLRFWLVYRLTPRPQWRAMYDVRVLRVTLQATLVHTVLWPVSVPVLHYIGTRQEAKTP